MRPAIVLGEGSGSGSGSGEGSGAAGVVLRLVSSTLTLTRITANDSGMYTCQAGNAGGNVSVDVLVAESCKKLFKHCLHCYFIRKTAFIRVVCITRLLIRSSSI